jgi:hypothetical protein
VDESAKLFTRGFAWYRLVRVWASLRFSDTEGAPPGEMTLTTRGLSLRLERTKTTGAGKKVLALPAYVSADAWIAEQKWLQTGFAIWRTWGADRRYMLPLPSADLDGIVKKRARYTDSAACSRAVLAGLRVPVCTQVLTTPAVHPRAGSDLDQDELPQVWTFRKEPLFLPAAVRFWSERSDRDFLGYAAASLGEPQDRRRLLGRWAPAAGDELARDARVEVESIQKKVARALRAGPGQADFLNEAETFGRLEVFLRLQGVSGSAVGAQRAVLTFFGDVQSRTEGNVLVDSSRAPSVPAPPPQASSQANLPGRPGVDREVGRDLLGKFVVSVSGKLRLRRLHCIGSCWMWPGRDYRSFEIVGDDPPRADQFDAVCRLCWRRDTAPVAGSESEEPTSSSSDVEEPTAGSGV